MHSRPLSRKVVALVLFAVLALPWVAAAGPRQEEAPASSFFDQVWSFLAGLWTPIDDGCRIDPSGVCQPEPKPTTIDDGCRIDPDGRCGA